MKDNEERVKAARELCITYAEETDLEETENILRVLDEIIANEPLEMPTQTIEEWEAEVNKQDGQTS